MKKIAVVFVAAIFFATMGDAQTIGAKDSKKEPAQTVYRCLKANEKIVIDGALDEKAWAGVPPMKFVGMVNGEEPFYTSEGKFLWDNNYLYVAFRFEEPDIRGYWGMDDAHLPDHFNMTRSWSQDAGWRRNECTIMYTERFAKVFLDPDGDGNNYIEFQISALNNFFDAWYKQGFSGDEWGGRERFPDITWKCPGLLSAVRVDGSLNNPVDVDNGWAIEMAIPWIALKPFTHGDCPPRAGDVWGAHTGRIFRDRVGGINTYWVWPFMGVMNSHLPDRYGKLIFSDEAPELVEATSPDWHGRNPLFVGELPKFERLFAWDVRNDPAFVEKAAALGVTDMAYGDINAETLEACRKHGIAVYKVVSPLVSHWKKMRPDQEAPAQQLSEAEEKTLAKLTGTSAGNTPAPEDWQVSDEQKRLIEAMLRQNALIRSAYQFGGEPEKQYIGGEWNDEVLASPSDGLLCFSHPETMALMKEIIAKELAEPGICGIAFDFIGYVNYESCHCPLCKKKFDEYCVENNVDEESVDSAREEFFLEMLVNFQNELVDYVKSVKPDAVVMNHVYPTFLPEPVYGNRLKVDYCGQTASWYTYWDPYQIARYTEEIVGKQNEYFPNAKGVPFIGYYDALQARYQNLFPYKSPERIEMELRSILVGGGNMLMVCGLNDVLENPEISAVFAKYMRNGAQ